MVLVSLTLLLYLIMEFNLPKKTYWNEKKNVDMPGNINGLIYFMQYMEKNWLWAFFQDGRSLTSQNILLFPYPRKCK